VDKVQAVVELLPAVTKGRNPVPVTPANEVLKVVKCHFNVACLNLDSRTLTALNTVELT
jgi:hypothetical protein